MHETQHPKTLEALEKFIRVDGAIIFAALLVLVGLSWAYLIWSPWHTAMAMPQTDIPDPTMSLVLRPWTIGEFSIAFCMWSVMMVGMMTPSIAPAVLSCARLARDPVARPRPLVSIGWFVSGYLLAWLGFAFIASVMQFLSAGLITPTLRASSDFFGGIAFVMAGAFQLSRLKDACLSFCRSPLNFIEDQGGFGTTKASSLRLGMNHGLYCVCCCWALMLILFVVGVMELLWIAVISIWVLLEKVCPKPEIMLRLSGFSLMATGIILLARATT